MRKDPRCCIKIPPGSNADVQPSARCPVRVSGASLFPFDMSFLDAYVSYVPMFLSCVLCACCPVPNLPYPSSLPPSLPFDPPPEGHAINP